MSRPDPFGFDMSVSSSKKKKGSAEEKVRLRDDPEARAEMTEMFGQGI